MKHKQLKLTILSVIFTLVLLPASAWGQSSDDLEDQIEDRSEQINILKEEIQEYEGELEDTKNEQATLQEAVSSLDSSVRNITGKVNETQATIQGVQGSISSLNTNINDLEEGMKRSRRTIAKTIKVLQRSGNQTLVETLLSADSLAEAWGKADQLGQIQAEVQEQLERLEKDRARLRARRQAAEERRSQLAELRGEYADQQAILKSQQQGKAELLAVTDQEASQYQNLIAKKRAQKEAFEAQLRQFEQQLNSQASGAAVPTGSNQFIYPVSPVVITQQFGGTEFAKRNPGAYGRPFHNGTDFGVAVGTDVKAVAAGTVRATGNTDAVAGCYSYGKWVLVDHNNGLATLYAHLSRRATSAGTVVVQGDRIGYSGNTGYSTGPHLHLTTYVAQDVQVVALGDVKERTNCAAARIPVAPLDSYLNSMDYLE